MKYIYLILIIYPFCLGYSRELKWSKPVNGITCALKTDKTTVKLYHPLVIEFLVKNTTDKTIEIPKPDIGTFVLYDGDEGGKVGEPGGLDYWVKIKPNEVYTHKFEHKWTNKKGHFILKATLRSRFKADKFSPIASLEKNIKVE